jgi:hypothetical protein
MSQTHRLTAILAADMAGYSRLMGSRSSRPTTIFEASGPRPADFPRTVTTPAARGIHAEPRNFLQSEGPARFSPYRAMPMARRFASHHRAVAPVSRTRVHKRAVTHT